MVRKFDPYGDGALMTIFVRGEQHDMLFSPNKNCCITPPPPHNDHLSTTATFLVPKVAVLGRFDCIKFYLQNDMLGKLIKKITVNIIISCKIASDFIQK